MSILDAGRAALAKAFNPDQPRDEDGKWTGGPGGGRDWDGKEKLLPGHVVHLEGDDDERHVVLQTEDERGEMPRVMVVPTNPYWHETGRIAPKENVDRRFIKPPGAKAVDLTPVQRQTARNTVSAAGINPDHVTIASTVESLRDLKNMTAAADNRMAALLRSKDGGHYVMANPDNVPKLRAGGYTYLNNIGGRTKKADNGDFTKGDKDGHPFRGNQHTNGQGGALPKPGTKEFDAMVADQKQKAKLPSALSQVKFAEERFLSAAQDIFDAGLEAEAVSMAHDAAERYSIAMRHAGGKESADIRQTILGHSHRQNFDRLSSAARLFLSTAREKLPAMATTNPKRIDDFADTMAAAADMMQSRIKAGARKVMDAADLEKGDKPGHPFRGNQHTKDGEAQPLKPGQRVSQGGRRDVPGMKEFEGTYPSSLQASAQSFRAKGMLIAQGYRSTGMQPLSTSSWGEHFQHADGRRVTVVRSKEGAHHTVSVNMKNGAA